MKIKYESPEFIITDLTKNDVLTTSNNELPVQPFGFDSLKDF